MVDMPFLPSLPAAVAAEELAELVLPLWAFPAIAAGIFLVLGLITWSYRDVYHRHNDKTSADDGAPNAHR